MKKIALICQRDNNLPFIYESALKNGVELIQINAPNEKPHMGHDCCLKSYELDIFSNPIQALKDFEKIYHNEKLDGIMTTREDAIPWTASATDKLNLPGITSECSILCRNKYLMRSALIDSGCNQPQIWLSPYGQEHILVKEINFPVVIKPISGSGSIGVAKVSSPEDFIQQARVSCDLDIKEIKTFTAHAGGELNALLVEEFIAGPEYVCDTFSLNGEIVSYCLSYKGNNNGPYFEKDIYEANALCETDIEKSIITEVSRALIALKLENGASHTELRLSNDNIPYIIEVGARIGGSGSSAAVVEKGTGVDLFSLQFMYSAGCKINKSDYRTTRIRYSGNYVVPLNGSGIFQEISGIDDVKYHPSTWKVLFPVKKGTSILPYPACTVYPCYILSVHDSLEELKAYHEYLKGAISIVWE